jgi:uncharacterized protein YndB with AHSA1/START domain
MSAESTVALSVTRHFSAPAERVFDAWLDPEKAGRFLFATPTGKMILVEIDARVGGRFTIVEHRPDGDAEHFGEYLEIARPRRLQFSFWVETEKPAPTTVTVEITPVEGGGCQLVLIHEGVWAEFADRTEAGWAMILDGLARVAG